MSKNRFVVVLYPTLQSTALLRRSFAWIVALFHRLRLIPLARSLGAFSPIQPSHFAAVNLLSSAMDPARERQCWLMKAEPESRIVKGIDVKFSATDFELARTTAWEGVRNHQAKVRRGAD